MPTLIMFKFPASFSVGLYGMEWEVAEIHNTPTYYKAFEVEEIHADIGVKIGLNAVNITLKGMDFGLFVLVYFESSFLKSM